MAIDDTARNLALATLVSALWSCSTAGPFVPDRTEKIPSPTARAAGDANDVFKRKPWEVWRLPNGIGRYHREADLLLPDEGESFKVTDVSVYAADGSDVRLDYLSVGFGDHPQSRALLRVCVYRAPAALETEWRTLTDKAATAHPNASQAEPFPLPDGFPPDAKRAALTLLPSSKDPSPTYWHTMLLHTRGWAVRVEIECPVEDRTSVQKRTLAFLRSMRMTR